MIETILKYIGSGVDVRFNGYAICHGNWLILKKVQSTFNEKGIPIEVYDFGEE